MTPTFEFIIPDNRRSILCALMVTLFIFATIIAGKIAGIHINWLLSISIIEFILLILMSIRLIWRKERIVFYPDYLESTLYGKIYFREIVKIASPWYFLYRGFKLCLTDKRSCHWAISNPRPSQPLSNTQEEVDAFNNFKEALEKQIKNFSEPKPY